MSKINYYRDRLDAKARQSHADYFGEHLSVYEREAIPTGDDMPSKSNLLLTESSAGSVIAGVNLFNGRSGTVVSILDDYQSSLIEKPLGCQSKGLFYS